MTNCKKCGGELTGKQTSYCSIRCSRRDLKNAWQKRRREVVNKAKAAWRKRTNRASDQEPKEKAIARSKMKNAIASGKIKRQPCEKCGIPNAQAHHPDYSKPLEVQWLCITHHAEIHRRGTIKPDSTKKEQR